MQLIRWYEDCAPWPKRMFAIAFQYYARTFQHEDLVFVSVRMFRRAASWGQLELTHGKTRRVVRRPD